MSHISIRPYSIYCLISVSKHKRWTILIFASLPVINMTRNSFPHIQNIKISLRTEPCAKSTRPHPIWHHATLAKLFEVSSLKHKMASKRRRFSYINLTESHTWHICRSNIIVRKRVCYVFYTNFTSRKKLINQTNKFCLLKFFILVEKLV